MPGNKVNVILDDATIKSLLQGLYTGAKRKALRAVRGADGCFYVESKEMRILVEANATYDQFKSIQIQNDKYFSELYADYLGKIDMLSLANSTVQELAANYTSGAHSLADSIYAFSKTYGH